MVLGSAMGIPLFLNNEHIFLLIAFKQWDVTYLFDKYLLNLCMLSLREGVASLQSWSPHRANVEPILGLLSWSTPRGQGG